MDFYFLFQNKFDLIFIKWIFIFISEQIWFYFHHFISDL